VIGVQEDYIYFEKFLRNSINWLNYDPIVYVKDWPKPYESAAIFTPEISDDMSNVRYLTGIIDKYDIPTTFFVDPYMRKENHKYARLAAEYGEIAAIVDVGYKASQKDTVNKLMDKETQTNNLIAAKDTLESIVGEEVNGFMPLYGFYNKATKQAMNKAGFDYLVTDSLTDRSVPNLEIWGDSKLIFITNTSRDDNRIINDFGLKQKNFQTFTYKEDVDRLKFEGGLYVLKVHSQYQMQPKWVDVIPDVINYIRDQDVWLTSISEIKDWWKRWRGIEITYDVRSKRRVAVEVNNPMEDRAMDFVVQLHFNKKVKNVQLSSNILYTELPEYDFNQSENVLYLYVEDLGAGESREFLIDFENIPS
jgi:peptidoglycan/xylan/chitin deacetylase (PgdA/CDA1 family)